MINNNSKDNPINLEDKKGIFYRLINSKDNKKKTRILENFWLNEKREPKENIKIIRRGIEILDKGTDKEKIYCYANPKDKPIEQQTCSITGNNENTNGNGNSNGNTETQTLTTNSEDNN